MAYLENRFDAEVGAIIGLSIGYVVKYNLDRRYVFNDSNCRRRHEAFRVGRISSIDAAMTAPHCIEDLSNLVQRGNAIARGNGRSYGDSAVSAQNTIHMKHFNRILAFNVESGQLIAESGVLLADIVEIFLKRGWFPSVTPGTKFVTLGGMIAADVMGKPP